MTSVGRFSWQDSGNSAKKQTTYFGRLIVSRVLAAQVENRHV